MTCGSTMTWVSALKECFHPERCGASYGPASWACVPKWACVSAKWTREPIVRACGPSMAVRADCLGVQAEDGRASRLFGRAGQGWPGKPIACA